MFKPKILPMLFNFDNSFIAKRVISILVNLRFKLLKYKENNKKMCNTFDDNFKNIPLYYNEKGIIRKVLFCIIRWCPYFKNVKKMALNPFCDKALHLFLVILFNAFQCDGLIAKVSLLRYRFRFSDFVLYIM